MEYEWIRLPLYDEWDFQYNAPLIDQEYIWRFYYEDRIEQWSFDLSHSTGEPVVEGQALLPLTPLLLGEINGVPGFVWLEPIQKEINEVVANPEHLYKYYRLFFIYFRDLM